MERVEFSARGGRVTTGVQLRRLNGWAIVEEHVTIRQKVAVHTPLDELLDSRGRIAAGGTGWVEINALAIKVKKRRRAARLTARSQGGRAPSRARAS